MKWLISNAAAVASAAALQVQDSSITKVVKLLGDMKDKVQKEVANETAAMKKETEFCDDEITETGFNIKTTKKEIEDFKADIVHQSAKISDSDSRIEKAGSEIATNEQELAAAKDVREKEHSDFADAEKELAGDIDMLARAASVLKRELSFVQEHGQSSSGFKAQWGEFKNAMALLIEAAWVNPKDSAKVQALLQNSDDDLAFVQQPAAHVANYESKSGGIVTAIEEMKDKAEEQLNELRRDELKKKQEYELQAQALTMNVANLNKELDEAKEVKSTASEAKGKAEGELSKAEDSLKADEEYLKTMTHDCEQTAEQWEARQKQAASEIEALSKGIEVLEGGVKVFAQVGAKTRRMKSMEVEDEIRDRLGAWLKKLGRKFNSFALLQAASAAGRDTFGKITKLIEDMIAKLEKQAQEEATKHAFCVEETKKYNAKREDKMARVDKHSARVEKAGVEIAELKEGVAELMKELAELSKTMAEDTKLRQEESSLAKKQIEDYTSSVGAVTSAISTLKDYYQKKGSFLQKVEFGSSNTDAASMLIGILETAQEDFAKSLATIKSEENESQSLYEKREQEAAVSKSTKEAEMKGKETQMKSVENSLNDYKSDLETTQKELDAVLEAIEKLKPQCENKAMTYEERKAKREQEMAGLKTALEILSGDAPAV